MAPRKSTSKRKPKAPPEWRMQEARAHFGELFRKAREEGPQCVRRRDAEAVVVLSAEEFDRLSKGGSGQSVLDFFMNSPLWGSGIEIERDRDYGRPVDL